MAPKIVDKQAKKKVIINAALKVFAAQGLVKAKMADVAREAGMGKGTIYEYFRSKEEIFAAGFNMFFENLEYDLLQVIQSTRDPVEQLRLVLDLSLKSLLGYGSEFAAIMMDFWAEGIRNKDRHILDAIDMRGMYEEFRRILRIILENGIKQEVFRPVNTLNVAAGFIGSLDGVMLQWIMDREMIDLEKVSDSLFDIFLNGLTKK